MSKAEQKILDEATITEGSIFPITEPNKITQVLVAHKILGKPLSSAGLKKLLKRCEPELTEGQVAQIYDSADKSYDALKALKREEKLEIAKATTPAIKPDYVIEMFDEDGMPTGAFMLDYIKYSHHLKKELYLHTVMNSMFVYNPENHTFREHINEYQTHSKEVFEKYNLSGKLTEIQREVTTHVNSMGCVREYPFTGKYGTIHVKNGSLDLTTGELSEPTAEHMYDYRIETEYKQFPNGTPELDAFLDIYKVREPIDILSKVIWQRAFHDTLKELVVLVGPKDCGKTTLVELVQSTLDGDMEGKNNVSRTLLHELLDKFGFASLEGRLMNFGDDLPDMFVKNSSRICHMVGSVNRSIEKKGVDGYDAIVTAYYVFTANNLPPLDDDDNAIWGKIRLVAVEKPITCAIKPRSELFTEVIKQQLLYLAVEQAKEYRKQPYVKVQSDEDVRKMWQEATTDVDSFLLEATKYDYTLFVSLDKIREHYGVWCAMNGKKRHMKYLQKKLQPYFIKRNTSNGYSLELLKLVGISKIVEPKGKQEELKHIFA